jgi:hypothetical protein
MPGSSTQADRCTYTEILAERQVTFSSNTVFLKKYSFIILLFANENRELAEILSMIYTTLYYGLWLLYVEI